MDKYQRLLRLVNRAASDAQLHPRAARRRYATARASERRRTISRQTRTAPIGYAHAMLTIFGSIAVTIMVMAYCFEQRSPWFILIFAGASLATAVYSGLAEVYPITVIEAIWSVIALRRFLGARRQTLRAGS